MRILNKEVVTLLFLYNFSKKIKNNIMMKKEFLYKMLIGFFAGIVSGLFASGGGMILVPAFMYLLKMEDVESRATSITCILPMVITSGILYYKNNYIDWNIGIKCAIGGIVGRIYRLKIIKKNFRQDITSIIYCIFNICKYNLRIFSMIVLYQSFFTVI